MEEYRLTPESYKKIKEELEYLKKEERKKIAERIKLAKSFGDLSENAEYAESLEAQRQLEKRISELEDILKRAVIVRPTKKSNLIDVGTTFEVENLISKKKFTFTLVGFGEADPLEGKISSESPMGKLFLGKKVGEKVEGEIAGKQVKFKIVKIL